MRADGAVLYDFELIQCEMKSISWPSHWFILDIFKKDNILLFLYGRKFAFRERTVNNIKFYFHISSF